MNQWIKRLMLMGGILIGISGGYAAESTAHGHEGESGFEISHYLFHHLLDDYRWHILSVGDFHLTLYLPVIVYVEGEGWKIFSSRHLYEDPNHAYKGVQLVHQGALGKPALQAVHPHHRLYDFSITRTVLQVWLTVGLLLLIFWQVGKAYRETGVGVPRRFLARLLEPLNEFLVKEIIYGMIPREKARFFAPYLLTAFYFILLANWLGLLPLGFNITGNISVTATLAGFTLILGHIRSSRYYWKHLLNNPDIPGWIKLLVPIALIELLGVLAKHVALAIRLFANVFGGHANLLTIVGLIFLFGGMSALLGWIFAPISLALALFILLLEVLIGLIQAFVFTVLSAFFIGMEVETAHDH